MKTGTPESVGIHASDIKKYLEKLENSGLSTHSLLIAKGNDIVFEHYWKPFHADFLHRQYSVSKSIVAIAIGFCEQDGLLRLDDKIYKYFPEYFGDKECNAYKKQTIRDMLIMATEKSDRNWFKADVTDRVKYYFENDKPEEKGHGMLFQYDSAGSFVLGALVEKLTGMDLIAYLKLKFLNKIGVSENIYCLQCPGGHAWGDSGVMCTARDLFRIARFVMNGGKWNGEQLLNEKYIADAISKQIDTNEFGLNVYDAQGYGYLIWRTFDNTFFFNGMGCQLAVCVPDKNLIMIYNGDNQLNGQWCKNVIMEGFFDGIVRKMSDKPLAENISVQTELNEYAEGLVLSAAKGEQESSCSHIINGKKYIFSSNPMGIQYIRFIFDNDSGKMEYENAQGHKCINFKMCKNAFGLFPQEGYSDHVGNETTKGIFYKCAASAAWIEPHKLFIKVQIIDQYFGRLNIFVSFREHECAVQMLKSAENFLNEYKGFAVGYADGL